MSPLVLIGQPDTKRALYLQKALSISGLSLQILSWEELSPGHPWPEDFPPVSRCFIKIDPPRWTSCSLAELEALTEDYKKRLMELSSLTPGKWLNHPRAILQLLDKKACKQKLSEAGLPVTEELTGFEPDPQSLLDAMKARHMTQIFLKPVYGSGAAGVTALRLHPVTGELTAYSCALPLPEDQGGLINTKKLRVFRGHKEVLPLLKALLSLDCLAERWYPKAGFQGFSYDLRAVCQEGQTDFLLARLSTGPVTNLHLNNHPLRASSLALPSGLTDQLHSICQKAMDCFPGLTSAGIDLLLEKGSLRPRIIEMNGQGDLIYEDIYHENQIYLHQAQVMKEWTERQKQL